MKSKKILKFLVTSILVATVTTSNALVFAKKEKMKTVEVVENPKNVIKVKAEEIPKEITKDVTKVEVEESSKDTTEKKINTKEEEKKIKEEDENFSENKKIETKKDEELFKKNKETFKNFDENRYKVDGFELITFYKNGAPILLYKHIKTGAIIIIIPINTINSDYAKTDLFALNDYYIFKAFKPDDSGLVHYLEHCITSNMLEKAQEKDTRLLYFNAQTRKDRLFLINSSIYADESFIENLAKELRNPTMLKDENVFKREKRRILNEAEKDLLDYEIDENKCIKMPQDENYNPCGTPEELKKISPDEVKEYFKQIIHPSNLLAIRYSNLNPDDVIKYIKILEKHYLKYFNHKKISDKNFRKKKYCNFKKIEACKIDNVIKSKNAMGEEKDYDYMAKINFLDPENQKEKDLYYKFAILNYRIEMSIKETLALEKFIKKLGYSSGCIDSFNTITLYGDDEKLFEKEKLIENHNKIFNYIVEKFENFSDEEIEKNVDFLRAFGYNTGNEYLNLEQKLFSNPMLIEKNKLLAYFLMDNFINFNDPLSKNTLEITENNEIKDSKEHYISKIKKDILNLKEFKNKTPSKIRVFFRSKNNKLGPEYLKAAENLKKIYIIPLKFKETKNKTLGYLVKDFLIKELCKVVYSKALNYYGIEYFNLIEDYFAFNFAPNKNIFDNNVLNFFYKHFTKYLENLKISKDDFENFKNNLEEIIKNSENEIKIGIKDFNKSLRAVKYYLKHGLDENADVYNEKKGGFKIDSKTTRKRLYSFFNMYFKWVPTLVAFSNFEEYLNYKKLKCEFILKYGHLKNLKHKDVLIDKEFVKDLKKHIIEPLEKAISNKEKFEKEIKNGLDSVSYEDFVKTLRSCSLVAKETYEKDQKKLDEIIRKTLGYSI